MVALSAQEYKGFFKKNMDPSDFRNGAWFEKLLYFAFRNYTEKVTAEYFQGQYPGLPPDAVVDLRIKIAKKYAAISGGTTSAAYTGLVFTTISTFGAAAPAAIPAAVAAIGTDLCAVSVLQLRLAYDISVLYNHRLNYEDPQDLTDLLGLAFGVETGNIFGKGVQKLAPEATTWLIKKTAVDSTMQWLKALPIVGRYLLERNIIKMAVPVVGVGLGSGLNYYFTGKIGQRAKAIFRKRVAIEDLVRHFPLEKIQDMRLLLDLIWLTIYSDKDATRGEAWFLREFLTRIEDHGDIPYLEEFTKRVHFDHFDIFSRLAACGPEERSAMLRAVYIAAAVDGFPNDKELAFVQKVAERAGIPYDRGVLEDLSENLK